MNKSFVAKQDILIDAPVSKVWDALVNPAAIKQYMFGTNVICDWKESSTIIWKGEWQGKSYEDKGKILKIESQKIIRYSHFSPMSGIEDVPENYHIVTVELVPEEEGIRVLLQQDNNPNEEARKHSEQNWKMMLENMKKYVEQS